MSFPTSENRPYSSLEWPSAAADTHLVTGRDSVRRVGVWLLAAGGVLSFAMLPFGYGDGGRRATDEGGGVLGWLAACAIALIFAGAGALVWVAVTHRKESGR